MEHLPCGHTSHSDAEERRWASAEFAAETERQAELCRKLVAYLNRKGPISPGPFPPVPDSYEARRIYEAKRYFAAVRHRLRRQAYLREVSRYVQAIDDFFALPPCQRDLKGVPLLPAQVPGLLRLEEVGTPRTGGRRPSQGVRDRNARIAEVKAAGTVHRTICTILDQEKWAVPPAWRKDDVRTWRQAYQRPRTRARIHSMFSKIATKR